MAGFRAGRIHHWYIKVKVVIQKKFSCDPASTIWSVTADDTRLYGDYKMLPVWHEGVVGLKFPLPCVFPRIRNQWPNPGTPAIPGRIQVAFWVKTNPQSFQEMLNSRGSHPADRHAVESS